MIGLRFGTLLCLGALLLTAQELKEYEKKVTEFTLPNGLHFILLERHQLPVISFHTYVNVGSTRDPAGQTGLAHLMERLAFKGTEAVGTKNWAAEKKALDDLSAVADRWDDERNLGPHSNTATLTALQVEMRKDAAAAQSLADPDEFARVIQENGGVGLSCKATEESIETSYNLPSNRIELWFLMESQRLARPVFRDFFQERDAMAIENQNTVDAKALPKLQQALLATAFAAHPYRNPSLGWPGDVANLRPDDAKAFFDTYWAPSNIVIGMVGDVDPANARRLADRYFGAIPSKPHVPRPVTAEPTQFGPKSVSLWGGSQPLLLVGYKRPDQWSRDDAALDVVRMILSEGRTSPIYKELVEERRIAQGVEAIASFPAAHYINLFVFQVVPAPGHTAEENQQALEGILTNFATHPVDSLTLERVKNQARARIVRVLESNQQLAALLPTYFANFGDWRKLFTLLGDYQHLTAEDLQRVAARYFVPVGRTVAYLSGGLAPATSSGPRGPQ